VLDEVGPKNPEQSQYKDYRDYKNELAKIRAFHLRQLLI